MTGEGRGNISQGGTIALVFLVAVSATGFPMADSTSASAQPPPRLSVEDVAVSAGESKRVAITLSEAPSGLAGYRVFVRLENPGVARITNASVPDRYQPAQLRVTKITDGGARAVLEATDLLGVVNGDVAPGERNVPLGTVTIRGESVGETAVSVRAGMIQDDRTPPRRIEPAVDVGTFGVGPGDVRPDATDQSDRSTAWVRFGGVRAVDGDLGGQGGLVSPNAPPSADAGFARVDDETVELDASDSTDPDGDSLTYSWTQVDGPAVSLRGSDTATPTFQSPSVGAEGALRFRVSVADGNGGVDRETVAVRLRNTAPTADAGEDQFVDEETTVVLNATGFKDPDGDIITYRWRQVFGPPVNLSNPRATDPTFTAPDVDRRTVLQFEARARDGHGGTDTDRVYVVVSPTNDPPVARTGDDRTVAAGSTTALNASASSDPNGDSLSYRWEQVGGPRLTLEEAETATPRITASEFDRSVTAVFEVTVTDEEGSFDTAEVEITVEAASSSGDESD